ncbi:scavenger receptor class F member 2 [Protopterus annectens]|uniref:scavenger receptor class F member 2 n=1 Tax=Protopterus annectens TaxID=7888 RepID=UPI001CFA797F|nr:scavenger receptor class F member 2 [Protopterus annectens]
MKTRERFPRCDPLLKFQMLRGVILLGNLFCLFCLSKAQELNPRGRNVCKTQGSSAFTCCSGWKQQGDECTIPLCEGNFTCKQNEVCVRPNECRCRHGYFGANCDTKCPSQFWGPDCKQMCTCHPNGRCDDITGKCTCNANRWGVKCENACICQRGKCDQETGKCACDANWWGPHCSKTCYCSTNSVCEAATGRCICQSGWWGRLCNNQCICNNFPCDQLSGRCQCREGTWGPRCERQCQCYHGTCNPQDGSCTCDPGFRGKFCREACPAGLYGQGCRRRCGQCKGQQPCRPADGQCLACEAGWNGTRCDRTCNHGFYGEGCEEVCPPCKDGHACNHFDGKCPHCNPGWIGDRCETKCPNGTYGENCGFVCNDCINGECHFTTGECQCSPGFYGLSCNMSCPPGRFGVNCTEFCSCHDNDCDAATGACTMQLNQRMGAIAAGALVAFLLILMLSLLCCCCFCRRKDEKTGAKQENCTTKKVQRRFCGRFGRISMKLPRIPLTRQKLPKVTVSPHDMENTFNCSFIEPPSVVDQPSPSWSSRGSFSSFDTTDDGPVYCVPHEDSICEKEKGSPNYVEKLAPPISEEDAGEYTYLKETGSSNINPADTSETPLLKSSDSDGSSSGSESTSGALYAKIARLSKQSKDDEENAPDCKITTAVGKPPSPERIKPPPPDPSTKPKVSWIHGKFNNQSYSLPTSRSAGKATSQSDIPENSQGTSMKDHSRKRSPSETSGGLQSKYDEVAIMKHKEKGQKSKESSTLEPQSASRSKQRNKANQEQLGNINGAVQNALKKIGNFHADKKGIEIKEAPKSPNHRKSRSDGIPPQLSSEAATQLAAQLKEKTQSLNRSESNVKQNGVASPQFQKEKPTPPQKAKRSVSHVSQKSSNATLPVSTTSQKINMPSPDVTAKEEKNVEKQDSNNIHEPVGMPKKEAGDQVPKRTPIKKPPRKKSKEATLDIDSKNHPRTPVLPPQTVK